MKQVVVVCSRVADEKPAVPGCSVRHCTGCFSAVWVSPSSLKAVPGGPMICKQCFAKVPHDDEVEIHPLTPDQIAELRAYYKSRRGS